MTMTAMNKRPFPVTALCVLAILSCGTAVADDSWETVMRDRNRQVQIDRASIIQSDGGTKVAWARVVLTPTEAAAAGYMAVQALNRYDCVNRSILTVSRRYLDARNIVVREERVVDPRPQLVSSNTVDERLWREVCRPPSVADLEKIADEVGRIVTTMSDDAAVVRPAVMTPPAVRERTPERREAAPTRSSAPAQSEAARAAVREALPAVPVRATAQPTSAAATPLPVVAAAAPAVLPAPRATPPATAPAAATRTPAAAARQLADWSYEGDTGPEQWGRLRPEWAVCASGTRQSPIDLRDGVGVDLEPVLFDYRSSRFRVTDTGKTLEVRVGAGLGAEIRGERFELTHFQFHSPSEIRINGRVSDLGLHLHHRDADGRIAIVAIAVEGGGEPHALIQTLWNSLPLDRGAYYMPQVAVDLNALLPDSPAHYLYLGSLTAPPCTEGVTWVVMKAPMRISDEQLTVFRRLYTNNARPVQALNDRLILESR